jgi:hypothetical protein
MESLQGDGKRSLHLRKNGDLSMYQSEMWLHHDTQGMENPLAQHRIPGAV